jgi:hypothetical protein
MPSQIPLRTDLLYYNLQIPLEGVTYTLQFRWNERAQGWYMDILDEAGITMYVAGTRIVVDYYMLAFVTGRQPGGVFVAVDTSGGGVDPGLTDLGDRVKLLYYTLAELQA